MHGQYIIQGLWCDSLLVCEDSTDDEVKAKQLALGLSKDPTFEGAYTRVITIDGELVWDSRTA